MGDFNLRIALFKDSRSSFLQALNDAQIPFEELRTVPGLVLAAGTMITVAQTAAVAGAVAAVLVAWLRARASRKVMLTLKDQRTVHLEGYSAEEVEELLLLMDYATVIDTKPAEESAHPFGAPRGER